MVVRITSLDGLLYEENHKDERPFQHRFFPIPSSVAIEFTLNLIRPGYGSFMA